MAQNIGTLITSTIRPNDSLDLIASAFANEIKGGHHGYLTFSFRDAIITERREWGMFCSIWNSTASVVENYQLIYNNNSTDISDNLNWKIHSTSNTNENIFLQNGNSYGATATLGTNDNQNLILNTNGVNRMIIGTNGFIGIGTMSPSFAFHLVGDSPNITVERYDNSTSGAVYRSSKGRGTSTSPLPIGNGDMSLHIDSWGYDGTSMVRGADIRAIADGTFSSINRGMYMRFSTTDVNSTTVTERMRINSNGNISIGTTSSLYRLDVISGTAISARFDGRVIGVTAVNSNELTTLGQLSQSYFSQNGNSFGSSAIIGTNDNQSLILETNGLNRMIIGTNGNIGFGITTSFPFEVFNDTYRRFFITYPTAFTARLNMGVNGYIEQNADGGFLTIAQVYSDISSDIRFSLGGTARIYIKQSGNLGVGIQTPLYRLDVISGTAISARFDGRVIGVTAVSSNELTTLGQLSTGLSQSYFSQNGNSFGATALFGTNDNQSLVLETNGLNRMTIGTNGNIGFGTSIANEQLELTRNLRLINTTQSAFGIIYKGSNRFIYDFSYGFNGTVTPTGNNLFFGSAAGNLSIGSNATQTFQSSYNLGIGSSALSSLTTAYNNIAIGASSQIAMSTGNSNISIGFSSLSSNIGGNKNIAIGYTALFSATTTGNVAVGHNAGSLLADGVTTLNAPNNSIFIGEATKSLTASQTNEIVIGHLAIGNGSNSATLGNTSITKTILQGNVLIGTTVDSGYKLDVNGAVKTANSSGYYINSAAAVATQVLTLDSGDNMTIRTPLGGDIYVRSNNNVLVRLVNDGSINIGGTVATTAPLFKITSGGNFGFGTSSPSSRMTVKTNGLSSSAVILLNMVTSNEESLFSVANNGNTTLGALSVGNSLSSITGRTIIRTTNVNMSGQLEIIPNTTMTQSGSPIYFNPNGSVMIGLTSSSTTPSANTLATGRLVVGTSISDSSAIFQVDSTTLGVLPPRMTSTQMNAISSPAIGLELYNSDARIKLSYNGTAYKSQGIVSGSYTSTGTSTTTFTVTFGGTQPNTTYKVNVTPTAALTAALFYVTNKTITTFDVTYLSALTGTVTFDYVVSQ